MRISKTIRSLLGIKSLEEENKIKLEAEIQIPDNNEDDFAIHIGFSVDKTGELIIHCEWDYEYQSEGFSEIIGSILKMLTTGGYDPIITKVMLESVKEDDKIDPKFVENILKFWKNELNDRPIVSPLKTFSESNFGANNL